jgi:hypothetical protein
VRQIGVERLDARYAEHDRTEDEKSEDAVVNDEGHRMARIERREHLRAARDRRDAEGRDRQKPDRHHGAEERADALGTARLYDEESDQNREGDRNDQRLRVGRDHAEPFHGGNNGDRRRDDAVAE